MTVPEIVEKVADEAIGLIVVGGTMIVMCYQAITGGDITMPTEAMMVVLAFYFKCKLQ
ncbi:hypothetical protein [Methanococcoides sp. FTZ1]|uniref:hypothetical protein n=1 Tax=Methanococcoides sp. FTZ1 TaxID=3439061 RepID=UPI003F86F1C8